MSLQFPSNEAVGRISVFAADFAILVAVAIVRVKSLVRPRRFTQPPCSARPAENPDVALLWVDRVDWPLQAVCTGNLNPDVVVVKSAEDRT